MSKYLVFFIITVIGIYILEIAMLGYLLFDLANIHYVWINTKNTFILFLVFTTFFVAFHIFWLYGFLGTWIRYKHFLKINDSLNAMALCTMAFSIFAIIFILACHDVFALTSTEIIILGIITFNMIIMAIFNIFILLSYHNFNQRFIKHILENTKK